jgi:hypothetical protein
MSCAPHIAGGKEKPIQGSCYSHNKLIKIAKSFNNKYPHNRINYHNLSSTELWKEIKRKLDSKCGDNEKCWVEQDFVKDKELKKYTFKPVGPKDKYEWLSTSNISEVMEQYELVYDDFKFIGPLPIDFADVMPDIIMLPFDKLYKKGIRRYGVIFNTDPSYKSGEHWISMYIDLNINNPDKNFGPVINFYDSLAVCPAPDQIIKYINYIVSFKSKLINLYKKEGHDTSKVDFTINCNNVQHQRDNNECGVYSMYYITESLKGKTFREITNNVIRDEEMNKKRKYFFSP